MPHGGRSGRRDGRLRRGRLQRLPHTGRRRRTEIREFGRPADDCRSGRPIDRLVISRREERRHRRREEVERLDAVRPGLRLQRLAESVPVPVPAFRGLDDDRPEESDGAVAFEATDPDPLALGRRVVKIRRMGSDVSNGEAVPFEEALDVVERRRSGGGASPRASVPISPYSSSPPRCP